MQTTRPWEDVSLFPVLLLAWVQARVGASVETDKTEFMPQIYRWDTKTLEVETECLLGLH